MPDFDIGGMWEFRAWSIELDVEIEDDTLPCPHCRQTYEEPRKNWDTAIAPRLPKHKWVCPRVVVAMNEGGHGSTGVCLDCIVAAAKTMPPPQ
jgi:hypothetical protein